MKIGYFLSSEEDAPWRSPGFPPRREEAADASIARLPASVAANRSPSPEGSLS